MLEIKSLSRAYGRFTALDNLSISVGDGELHGFVGPNGAGKTTTMRILATLLPATSGTALVDGLDVRTQVRQVRKKVGYMPDFFGVYDKLKAWEYLDFYARCYGLSAGERKKMIDSLLDLMRLSDKRDAYVDVLSRGMKQRLCLARALIHDPKLLILDEPASGMDPRARADMKGVLHTLRDMGKTVLVSSHILSELSQMCDSLTILDHGKLVFSGTVDALSAHMHRRTQLKVRLTPDAGEDAVSRAAEVFRQTPLVTGVSQDENDILRVDFDADAAQTAALLSALLSAGVPVMDYHRASLNLEKVFMEVTKDD